MAGGESSNRRSRRRGQQPSPVDDPPQPHHQPQPALVDNDSDHNYMMLRDEDVERLTARARGSTTAGGGGDGDATQTTALRHRLHTRDLQSAAERGVNAAAAVGERAANRVSTTASALVAPIGSGARRVSDRFANPRMPFLHGSSGRRRGDGSDGDGSDAGETGDGHETDGSKLSYAPTGENRFVYINQPDRNTNFPSNYVSTTKYSPLNVVPKFLFEQFTRFSNAYFLFVGILYCIDEVTPVFTVGRYSGLWVLCFVVSISGVKEAIEDVRRYRQDRMVNRANTEILGSMQRASAKKSGDRWDSVKVGDILKVRSGETFPADLVLLASSSDDGLAFIETKQLDGESNLKVKVAPQSLANAFSSDARALLVRGVVECEAPNDRLYKFAGSILLDRVPPSSQSAHTSTVGSSAALPSLGTPVAGESSPDQVTIIRGTAPGVSVASMQSATPTSPGTSALLASQPSGPLLDTKLPLGPENILIRGSSLRNTEYVLGLVINTGRDTKLMQNVKPRPRKNSRLERMTNKFLFLSLALQVAIVIALTVRSSQLCQQFFVDGFAWYLFEKDGCTKRDSGLRFFTFFATFSGLIPISLYVSMEVARGFQVYFMERDMKMKDEEHDVKAEVRTSNLNEELGVVHYVFTDKTGTLTANRMDFKKCTFADRVFTWSADPEPGASRLGELQDALDGGIDSSSASSFTPKQLRAGDLGLRLLAVCHSVVAEVNEAPPGLSSAPASREVSALDGRTGDSALGLDDECPPRNTSDASFLPGGGQTDITYQASSPDEAALVIAARAHGYVFVSRSNRELVIQVNGELEEFELLEVLEFDSTRKRMSVIVRCPDGQIRLFCKGADSVIFERLAADQDPSTTAAHLHDFAVEGLRTLCLAYADLDDSWYRKWKTRYMKASSKLEGRDEAVAAIAEEVEKNLQLLGATAIEDKLQDGVPETLRMLEQASVKIWVLTGDKQETAINIGLSCGAIEDGMDVYIINEDNLEDTAAQIDCAIGRWNALLHDPGMERKLGLVIDGQTLHFALRPELQRKLMHLARMARSVIACRVSPKQKTELVELVRSHEKDKVTLAIGDGANDVGMIQAAHVGVGIVGVEGQEAKLASDYSIGQFRFLGRLMLVHGRWSYKRLAKMILYTVYKNMALTLCELYWASLSGYSGQPLLDPWMAGVYNLFSTSLPPIVLGILDQELSADYGLMFPEIYAKGQRNTAYNLRVFIYWILTSVWQSLLVFYTVVWGVAGKPQANGQHLGMWAFGTIVFTMITIVVHAFGCLYQSSWTALTAGLYFLSFISWFIIGPAFSTEAVSLSTDFSPPLFGVTHRIFVDPRVLMLMLLLPVMCVTPGLLWKYSKRQRRPNVKMLVQELIRTGRTREELTADILPKILRRVPSYDPTGPATPVGPATFVKGERQYAFSGFNFDGDEGVSLLVRRHAYANSKGVRRRRMRVLKRAGSDTELDVAGVQTARVPSSPVQLTELPSGFGGDRSSRGGRRRGTNPDAIEDPPGGGAGAQAGGGAPASHRRALSDGAVLVEDRYERVHRDADVDVRRDGEDA